MQVTVAQGFDRGKPGTVKGETSPENGPQDGKPHGVPRFSCSVLDWLRAVCPAQPGPRGPTLAGRPDPHPPLSSLCLPPALGSGSSLQVSVGLDVASLSSCSSLLPGLFGFWFSRVISRFLSPVNRFHVPLQWCLCFPWTEERMALPFPIGPDCPARPPLLRGRPLHGPGLCLLQGRFPSQVLLPHPPRGFPGFSPLYCVLLSPTMITSS